jgi:predicted transcriptional regulator
VDREYSIDPLARVRVEDVMDPGQYSIPADMTTGELAKHVADNTMPYVKHLGIPIVDHQEKLVGIITRGDLLRSLKANPDGAKTVLDAGTPSPLITHPDEPLNDAVARMAYYNVGRLPVIDEKVGKVVGYLGRSAILTARQRLLEEEHEREPGWIQHGPFVSP